MRAQSSSHCPVYRAQTNETLWIEGNIRCSIVANTPKTLALMQEDNASLYAPRLPTRPVAKYFRLALTRDYHGKVRLENKEVEHYPVHAE